MTKKCQFTDCVYNDSCMTLNNTSVYPLCYVPMFTLVVRFECPLPKKESL